MCQKFIFDATFREWFAHLQGVSKKNLRSVVEEKVLRNTKILFTSSQEIRASRLCEKNYRALKIDCSKKSPY